MKGEGRVGSGGSGCGGDSAISGGRPRAPTGPGMAATAASGSGGSGRCAGGGAGAGRRGRSCRASAAGGGAGAQTSGGSSGSARWTPGPQGASSSGRNGSAGSGGSSARARAEGGGGPELKPGGNTGSGGCGRDDAGGGVGGRDARARLSREYARPRRGCERERERGHRVASLAAAATPGPSERCPQPGSEIQEPAEVRPANWSCLQHVPAKHKLVRLLPGQPNQSSYSAVPPSPPAILRGAHAPWAPPPGPMVLRGCNLQAMPHQYRMCHSNYCYLSMVTLD